MSLLDLFRLDGRVAVVTGASSGLGAAFALALAEYRPFALGHAAGLDKTQSRRRTTREPADAPARRRTARPESAGQLSGRTCRRPPPASFP